MNKTLPNVALFPKHGKLGFFPRDPLYAKSEIFCDPYLEDKNTSHRRYILTECHNFNNEDFLSTFKNLQKSNIYYFN